MKQGFDVKTVNTERSSVLGTAFEPKEFKVIRIESEYKTKSNKTMEMGFIQIGNQSLYFNGCVRDAKGQRITADRKFSVSDDESVKFWNVLEDGSVKPNSKDFLIGSMNNGTAEKPLYEFYAVLASNK